MARETLQVAERRAQLHGLVPLLARIEQSLRLAGVQRTSERRNRNGALTEREREVLDLVGLGLRSSEISRRLGISRETVETLIESARRSLGARTRSQAVAITKRR
jgi:DNA-binding CsgD family transcriptional regulator